MKTYYAEKDGYDAPLPEGLFKTDEEAISYFRSMYEDLLIVYKESETPDGLPFLIVWEKA